MLYTDPVDAEAQTLPSPEELRRKILVKAKRLPPGKSQEDELELSEDEEDDVKGNQGQEEDKTDGVASSKKSKKAKVRFLFQNSFCVVLVLNK